MQLPDIIALANLFASRAFPLNSGAATGLRRSLRGSRAVGGARSPLSGEPSAHLPPTAFVSFLQNHDQIGNRAFGERLDCLAPAQAVEALTAASRSNGPHRP